MIARLIILLSLLHVAGTADAQSESANALINPTGLYKMVNKTKIKNGDTYGYFGDIKVKLITPSSIVMSFYVCKGAPSYNSGSFTDTLVFENNQAVFRTDDDLTCSIIFRFSEGGIHVQEKSDDYNSGCGFGSAVIADGYYRKTSSKILEIKSASSD